MTLGGVSVDRDQLVAEHVHRHLEVRDAADVVDQLGTIRERMRTPSLDTHVGREARFDHGEVTPVDTAGVARDEVVDRGAVGEEPDRI